MITSSAHLSVHQIRALTGPIAEAVTAGASRVKTLIRERRRIALTFRRTQNERDRAELERIDQELAKHGIDIPAIQERTEMRKQGILESVFRRAY